MCTLLPSHLGTTLGLGIGRELVTTDSPTGHRTDSTMWRRSDFAGLRRISRAAARLCLLQRRLLHKLLLLLEINRTAQACS